jgi:hydrocephalus-inducing protein
MPTAKFKTGVKSTVDTGSASSIPVTKSKVVAPRNPKLILEDDEDDKQSPSAYLSEMSMTTDERFSQTYEMKIPRIVELLDMSEMTHQKSTIVDIEKPLFQPFPSEIVYQNYEAHETYKIPLQLRNNDRVARLVKVTQTASPYFKIISPNDVGHKVAPGMDSVFYIEFTPDQKKDYNHELVCITEREKFLVPIRCVGARAILDFPDEVDFGINPVKYEASKTLLIRNIGNREARFNLDTKSPFSVTPSQGILNIGECMQISLNMQANTSGQHPSYLVVQYDTSELFPLFGP